MIPEIVAVVLPLLAAAEVKEIFHSGKHRLVTFGNEL